MKHLLLISLGPVQDFIAQARRSRDLWFGSHLLSELSRAAAKSLAGSGAKLIFPALEDERRELEPCDNPTRPDGKSPVAIANKILAELPAGIDAPGCAKCSRKAVSDEWRAIAARVRRERGKDVLATDADSVWHEQVEDVLEFYAVWVPLGDNYDAARRAAEQALAGRKNLRDFRRWQHDRIGAPKSSLDGARVSVLGDHRDAAAFRRLRVSEGEQLDAIGLIKRAGFNPDQFVPLANVAAADWLQWAVQTATDALTAVCKACADKKIPPVNRDLPAVKPLPFDASVLYPSRWAPLFKELEAAEDAAAARKWGDKYIRPLFRAMRDKQMRAEPPSYVACLVADGDHMGKAIGELRDADENRAFSKQLAQFPTEARRIVEQEHLGSLVYAGGDDVLAFLPVARAPACAAALAEAFRSCLEKAVPETLEQKPTLSVGIAVGHMLEAMSLLLELGRTAERAAKDAGRNALAIIVDKRSGGQRRLALCWKSNPLDRMRKDAELLKDKLATGKLHELEALRRRFPDPKHSGIPAHTAAALAAYAADILAHSGEGKSVTLDEIGVAVRPDTAYPALHRDLGQAIDRILIVRSLREWGFA